MKTIKKLTLGSVALGVSLLAHALTAEQSQAVATFIFQQVGNDVTMTSSGSIDTAGLVPTAFNRWGQTGVEENGQTDIMGGTNAGSIDSSFGFNAGTDFSQWQAGNPFRSSFLGFSVTSGSKGFTTYTRDARNNRVPGLGILASQHDGTVWTPDQNWIATNQTLVSIGLNPGTYTVTDSVSGEALTYQIVPATPIPLETDALPIVGSLAFMGAGLWVKKRRKGNITIQ